MKNIFFASTLFFATLAAAFLLERTLAGMFSARVPVPPLVLLSASAWMPVFPLPWRLWLGGSAGLVMDTFDVAPFGTWIILMLGAAFLAEFLLLLVSVRESAAVHAGVSGALAAAMVLAAPMAQAAFTYVRILLP